MSMRLGRLKLVGAGLAFAGLGIAQMLRGIELVTHWTGQPMFSWGLVAVGAVCLLLAVLPASWITKATRTPRSRTRRSPR